jgi:hypothetical protein
MAQAADKRRRANLRTNKTIIRLALYGAIGASALLGIPPFTAAVDALLGNSVDQALIALSAPLFANLIKYGTFGVTALLGVTAWKTAKTTEHRVFLAGMCATVASTLWFLTPAQIMAAISGSAITVIGAIFWGGVNFSQMYYWSLRRDKIALQKLHSRIGKSGPVEAKDDETPDQFFIRDKVTENEIAKAFSNWRRLAFLSYPLEVIINVVYGKYLSGISFAALFAPAVFAAQAWSMVSGVVAIFASVGLYEYAKTRLDELESLREVIEEV